MGRALENLYRARRMWRVRFDGPDPLPLDIDPRFLSTNQDTGESHSGRSGLELRKETRASLSKCSKESCFLNYSRKGTLIRSQTVLTAILEVSLPVPRVSQSSRCCFANISILIAYVCYCWQF
jgi:hypothetical protein